MGLLVMNKGNMPRAETWPCIEILFVSFYLGDFCCCPGHRPIAEHGESYSPERVEQLIATGPALLH